MFFYVIKNWDNAKSIMGYVSESIIMGGSLFFKTIREVEEYEKITAEEWDEVLERYDNLTSSSGFLPLPPPTDQELIQAELILNQTKILNNQEQQDTVLAELLLNQIGGI